jgi:pimeloyl-ACP methyl ester carboxylesterase
MSGIAQGHGAGLAYLSRTGGNIPIVLLHGIGSHARSFVPLIEALDPCFSVLAWDAPGYGDSAPLSAEWPDASDYAVALNRLLAYIHISRCVLVGHSLGALIAARFAIVSPNRVMKLCLISPALGYGAQKEAPLPPPAASRLDDLDSLGPEKFAAKRAPGLLGDPQKHPEVLQQVERAMAAVRRPGYEQATRMLAGGRLLEDAAKLSVPTAVLVGAQDRITPPENVRRVFEALPPAARLAYGEFAGAGHVICQEQPLEIARAIAAIVDSRASAHA